MAGVSSEYAAFKACNHKLCRAFRQARVSLCRDFFGEKIISQSLYNKCNEPGGDIEKFIMDMVDAIEKRIENDSRAYYVVIKVLQHTSAMEYLATILEEERKNNQEKQKPGGQQESEEQRLSDSEAQPLENGFQSKMKSTINTVSDKFRSTPDSSGIDERPKVLKKFEAPLEEPTSKQIADNKTSTDLWSYKMSTEGQNLKEDLVDIVEDKLNHKQSGIRSSYISDGSDAYQSAETSPKPSTKSEHKYLRSCCKKIEKKNLDAERQLIRDLEIKLELEEKNKSELQCRIKTYQEEQERMAQVIEKIKCELHSEKEKVKFLLKELDDENHEKKEERTESKILQQDLENKVKDERAKKEKIREEKEIEKKLRRRYQLDAIESMTFQREFIEKSGSEVEASKTTIIPGQVVTHEVQETGADDSRNCERYFAIQPTQLIYQTFQSVDLSTDKPIEETS